MRQTEVRGYVPALKRWWPTLLATTITAGLVGASMAIILPNQYEARSQLLVGPVNASADAQRAAGTLARTYAELIVSETFLAAAVEELGLSETPEELREERVRANGSTQTRFVVITATQRSPEGAANLVNFLANRLIEVSDEGSAASPEGVVTVIDPAVPPIEPAGPSGPVLGIVAALAGLLSMLLLAVASEHFGDRVRDRDDLAATADADLLGVIDVGRAESDPMTQQRRDTLRRIASALLLDNDGRVSTGSAVAVVPVAEETSREIAVDLARTLGEFGRRVAIMDGTSGIERAAMGVSGATGLAATSEAGPGTHDAARAHALIEGARKDSDMVVVATPALSTSSDALVWADAAGSIVLVASERGHSRSSIRNAVTAITAAGGTIRGVLATKSRGSRGRSVTVTDPSAQRVTSTRSRG